MNKLKKVLTGDTIFSQVIGLKAPTAHDLIYPFPFVSSPIMERAHLPTLDLDNFPIWFRTLEVLASDLRLDDHLNASTTAPTDPADFANYKRQQDRLSLIILSSLPKAITSTLPP